VRIGISRTSTLRHGNSGSSDLPPLGLGTQRGKSPSPGLCDSLCPIDAERHWQTHRSLKLGGRGIRE